MKIQDLIPIPSPFKHHPVTLSTEVPMSCRYRFCDEAPYIVYGRELDIVDSPISRFKMIEMHGSTVIERLVVAGAQHGTRLPTELLTTSIKFHNKDGTTTQLQCLANTASLSRELCCNAIRHDWTSLLTNHMTNIIHLSHLVRRPDMGEMMEHVLKNNYTLIQAVSPDDGTANSEAYNQVTLDIAAVNEGLHSSVYGEECPCNLERVAEEAIAMMPKLDITDTLSREGIVKPLATVELKPLLSPDFNKHTFFSFLEENPYKDAKRVIFTETHSVCRAALHRVVSCIYNSPYTNLAINYSPATNEVSCRVFNMYTGLSFSAENANASEDLTVVANSTMSHLLDYVDAWLATHPEFEVDSVSILKSLDENIYITVREIDGCLTRYLIDAFTYGLCTWGIVGM